MKRKAATPLLQPRFRVLCGENIALGPGKAELLEQIDETGSLTKAAARMDMSYMRAWLLVRTMNACFREPIVTMTRGGRDRGGANLTPVGRAALELYRGMEEQSRSAVDPVWAQLRQLLKS